MKRTGIASSVEEIRPVRCYCSFVGRENMWATVPARIDPMMPSTIIQKIFMCMCITDFAIHTLINSASRLWLLLLSIWELVI